MPLAEALLVGPHDERHVRELRRRLRERVVEQYLLRRVGDVIVATNDMRDRHVDVVDDDGEVIGGIAVGAQDDEILDVLVLERDLAAHQIDEARLAVRDLEADRPFVQVGLFREDERVRVLAVFLLALRLEVRRMRAADVGPLIPVETEPAQAVDDAGDHLPRRALRVGVLDAQHERAAMPPREQPVEERRARAADVQVAGRGWSETNANGHQAIVLRASRLAPRASLKYLPEVAPEVLAYFV